MFKEQSKFKDSHDSGAASGRLPSQAFEGGVHESQFLSLDQNLKPAFKEVLDSYGIDTSETPAVIIAKMKEAWWGNGRGLTAQVRAQFPTEPSEHQNKLITAAGHIEPVLLPPITASHALLMGGPLPWVRDRLDNLVDQWDKGVRFEKLVMLGADRPLEARHAETVEHFLNGDGCGLKIRSDWEYNASLPFQDEMDMMERVFEQSVLPAEWGRTVPVLWIKSLTTNGKRPNTEQTVVDYLAAHSDERHGLVVTASSQPFVHYQNLVTAAVFAEAGVAVTDFAGTGAGRYVGQPDVCPEFAYLDQMIRRFEYELRFLDARKSVSDQLDTGLSDKRPGGVEES